MAASSTTVWSSKIRAEGWPLGDGKRHVGRDQWKTLIGDASGGQINIVT